MTGPGFDYENLLAAMVAAIEAIDCAGFRFIDPPNGEQFRNQLVIDQDEAEDHWAHLDFRIAIGDLQIDNGGAIGVHRAAVLYVARNPTGQGAQATAGNLAAIRAGQAVLQVLENLPVDCCLTPLGLTIRPIPGVEWYRCEASFTFPVSLR